MKNFPSTITAENFNDVAKLTSKFVSKSKKKSLIRKIIKPVSGILFLLLSFLLVYGAIFNLCDPEDMFVFEKLEPITKLWTLFSGTFTTVDMAWYLYWPILIVATFVIPLLVSAIITIIVSFVYKTTPLDIPEGSDAEKAKALRQSAMEIKKQSDESDSYEIVFTIAFLALLVAFIVFAFIVLKIPFSMATILSSLVGMAIVGAILYYVYSIIFLIFAIFNGKFYEMPNCGNIVAIADAYWLSVDPEEAARRKEEEKRKAREAEEKRALGAEKRILGLEAERNGRYSTAKQYFKDAAELGDALGMDNYARHCLIEGKRSDAIYWLQKSIDTGEADETSRELLRALKNGQHIDVHYN